MSDHMELGDSGLVPEADGWMRNKHTNERISPEGVIYSPEGEVVFDPAFEEAWNES